MRTLAILGFTFVTGLAGCASDQLDSEHELAPGDLAAEQSELELDDIGTGPAIPLFTCASEEPDHIYYVGDGYSTPPSALPQTKSSGNARYYYEGCGRYVVDVNVSSTSPELEIYGNADDLPSSKLTGGTLPNNAIDCAAFREYRTFYHKKGSGSFTQLGYQNYKGAWSSSSGICNRVITSGTMGGLFGVHTTPGVGWDTYRVAVGVKLRGSGQEVEVNLGEWIEPPS